MKIHDIRWRYKLDGKTIPFPDYVYVVWQMTATGAIDEFYCFEFEDDAKDMLGPDSMLFKASLNIIPMPPLYMEQVK